MTDWFYLFVEVAGDALDFAEEAEGVFAEDFANVGIGVTLFQEGVGDLGDVGDIFHADGHDGAIEIGAEADVIDAGDFHGVIDVIDDDGPIDFGKLAGFHEIANDLIAGDVGAGFVVAATLFHFFVNFLFGFGMRGFEIAELLAEEADVVIDLDDAAVFGEVADHVVGHVARGVAEGAAGGVRGDDGSFADGENIVKRFVGDVGDVDDHAETIHFADDVFAEIGEAVVFGLGGGGIGPFVISPCG